MVKKIALGLVVILALAAFLVSRDWDSPELGRTLLGKVGQATGIQISAEGFKLNLLRGLVLEGVSGTAPGEGGSLAFTMDRLVFEHRVMPLFSGTVAIDRVLLVSPRLEYTAHASTGPADARPAGSPEAGAPTAGGTAPGTGPATGEGSGAGLALDVTLIRIEQATLVTRSAAGEEQAAADGLDFEMTDLRLDPSRSGMAALSARGTLAIATLRAGDLELRDMSGAFELAEARFSVPSLRFATPSATVVARTLMDFNPVPFTYDMEATSEHDLNAMLETPGGLGPATARFEAKGTGSDPQSLTASGDIQLAAGHVPASPTTTKIDEAIGKPVLANAAYEATKLAFTFARGHLTLEPFRLTTPAARLELGGRVDLAGPIDIDIALATPREGLRIEGVGATALDVLADDEGWVPVPIAVTGTLEDPKVRPDVKTLASMAASGTKREVKAKATDALRGFIKREER